MSTTSPVTARPSGPLRAARRLGILVGWSRRSEKAGAPAGEHREGGVGAAKLGPDQQLDGVAADTLVTYLGWKRGRLQAIQEQNRNECGVGCWFEMTS